MADTSGFKGDRIKRSIHLVYSSLFVLDTLFFPWACLALFTLGQDIIFIETQI